MTSLLERRFAEQAENAAIRADQGAILGVLAGCEPSWRNGAWWCLCPLHSEKTPSCKVSERGGVWRWYDFGGCGGGDVFDLVQRLEGVDFREARRRLGAGARTPAFPVPTKRPQPHRRGEQPATHALVCEAAGCGATRDTSWLEVVIGLGNGIFAGGPIREVAQGDIRWICRLCCQQLAPTRQVALLYGELYDSELVPAASAGVAP